MAQWLNMNKLDRLKTGLLLIDVQEKLFPYIENSCHVMQKIQMAVRGFQVLHLPIFVSEQYVKGLGETVASLQGILDHQVLEKKTPRLQKTAFSCMDDPIIKETLLNTPIEQWVLIGIEAHVCVLQTAKDLLQCKKQVIVLNDAIGSRSIYDFSSAIAELRDCQARISSTETVLFELLRDSKAAEFKEISQLIK